MHSKRLFRKVSPLECKDGQTQVSSRRDCDNKDLRFLTGKSSLGGARGERGLHRTFLNPNSAASEVSILELLGRDWQALPEFRRDLVIETCFQYWRARGFPFDQLDDTLIGQELRGLARAQTSRAWERLSVRGSTVGLRLANFFHPAMWSVRCRDAYCPQDRFNCDRTLRRMLRHALTIWPNKRAVNCTNLRAMLRTFSRTTRVSNFRPTIAKAIVERFSNLGDTVLDFSAGYSGRLLGCLAAGRRYLGIDPSANQIDGASALVHSLRRLGVLLSEPELLLGPAEDVLCGLRSRSIKLIFSSPPYFDRERYSDEPTQSYIRFPRYEQWKQGFLERVLIESARILKTGGYLVLNVSNVEGFAIADDAKRIGESLLRPVAEYQMFLARKPYLSGPLPYKYEPLLVFQST